MQSVPVHDVYNNIYCGIINIIVTEHIHNILHLSGSDTFMVNLTGLMESVVWAIVDAVMLNGVTISEITRTCRSAVSLRCSFLFGDFHFPCLLVVAQVAEWPLRHQTSDNRC